MKCQFWKDLTGVSSHRLELLKCIRKVLEVKVTASEEVRGLRHQTPVESVCMMMASPIVTASLVGGRGE